MAGAALPLCAVLAIACTLPLLSERASERADTLLAQNRTDPALVESDLAISLDPLSTGALLDRATILQLLGRPKDAAADVRRALRLEPANADTWLQAAELQAELLERPQGRVQERADRARACAVHGIDPRDDDAVLHGRRRHDGLIRSRGSRAAGRRRGCGSGPRAA